MSAPSRVTPPAPLTVAASLAALQGFVLVALAVAELLAYDADRAVMNVTTTIGFLGLGGALLWCDFNMVRGNSWARSPVVLAQLIQLGLAWSFRDAPLVSVILLVTALVTIAGILHPDSLDHLADPVDPADRATEG